MYTLRKVIDNVQSNQNLGNHYQVIERETNYEEFCKAYQTTFNENHVADSDPQAHSFSKNCYAFVIYNDGGAIMPLYKKQAYYIMTESGKTFSNLTYK